jgi:DNA primase
VINEAKQNIDLVSVAESAGVEFVRRGTRHVGLCPFHTERTPSFFVFPDNHYKCFGCGASGDCIDFVQKLHGLSFRDALKHLGIDPGPVTPAVRRDIAERKRRSELVKQFREWEILYCIYVSDLLFKTKKLMMSGIPPEDLEYYASLFHKLPVWQHHIDILTSKDDTAKYKLYKEAHDAKKSF